MEIISVRSRSGMTAAMVAMGLMTGACGAGDGDDSGKAAATSPVKPILTPASNGVAEKSADGILKAAKNTLASATSVQAKGRMAEVTNLVPLDLHIGRDGAKGTMKLPVQDNWHPVSIIIVNDKFYMKGPEYWRAFGGGTNPMDDRWLLVPQEVDFLPEALRRFADLRKLSKEILNTDGEVFTKGPTSVIGGRPAIALRGKDKILYVATTGKPYLLRIEPLKPEPTMKEGIDFLNYDAPLEVTPPADPVDDPAELT